MKDVSIPSRARAVVFDGPGKPLRLVDLPVSWPKAGEAIVQVELTTIDPQDFLQGDAPAPLVLGYETVGTILALGDPPPREFSGGELAVGDRVIWSRYVSCGECFYCRRRLPQECESLLEYGRHPLGDPPRLSGGMAELVHLWAKTVLFKVPKTLPKSIAAAISHAGAMAIAGIDCLISPISTALILGADLTAQVSGAMLRKRGARSVIIASSMEKWRELATTIGAATSTTVIGREPAGRSTLKKAVLSWVRTQTENRLVDGVIELTGAAEMFALAVDATRIGGAICLQGSPDPREFSTVSMNSVVQKNLRITGVHRHKPEHLASAIDFASLHAGIGEGKFAFQELIPSPCALSEANKAIAEAINSIPFRVAFEPDLD